MKIKNISGEGRTVLLNGQEAVDAPVGSIIDVPDQLGNSLIKTGKFDRVTKSKKSEVKIYG
jgi:hypothetical protein